MTLPADLVVTPVSDVQSVPAFATGVAVNTDGHLYGWCFRESTGAAAAQVDIYDGGGTDGALIASLPITQSGSTVHFLGWPGIHVQRGLFVSVTSGSVVGAVWYAPNRGE